MRGVFSCFFSENTHNILHIYFYKKTLMEKRLDYAGENGSTPITERAITGKNQAGMDQGPHV